MEAVVCLVVFIGLPGSGKTTFARSFSDSLTGKSQGDSRYNVVHVCYDDLMPLEESSAPWKAIRKNLLRRVDELINSNIKIFPSESQKSVPDVAVNITNENVGKTVILIDDNMYYRSMRYEFYQLARNRMLSFCQLYFKCSLEIALRNNLKRETKSRVPEDVIVKMSSRLEPPDAERNSWERFSLTLTQCMYNKEVEDKVLHLVEQSAEAFVPRHVLSCSNLEESRAACSASVLHQADILSRKLLGEVMVRKREEGLGKHDLHEISVDLNTKRQTLMSKIRAGEIWYPENANIKVIGHRSLLENNLQDWLAKVFARLE